VGKTAVLFLLLNLLFAWAQPLETLGRVSLYNWLLPGRERLPYGENPGQLQPQPLQRARHARQPCHQPPKAPDEFRVLLLGDSGTWGWFLENDDTLAGQLNAMGLTLADGRSVTVYNLGYPVMALSKDVAAAGRGHAIPPGPHPLARHAGIVPPREAAFPAAGAKQPGAGARQFITNTTSTWMRKTAVL
jgi:hypothetical protein